MSESKLPYFICGLGIGAALGILYAPRSGEETREELRVRANEGREFVRRRADEGREYVRERAGESREYLKKRTEEGREYVRERGTELKQKAEEVVQKGRGAVETQRGQLAAALEAGRKAYREATVTGSETTADSAEASEA
jgi:gas vesicle protein